MLVARANAHASIEVEVGQAVVGSGETILAVEGGSEAWNNAANLVSTPIAQELAACLL